MAVAVPTAPSRFPEKPLFEAPGPALQPTQPWGSLEGLRDTL